MHFNCQGNKILTQKSVHEFSKAMFLADGNKLFCKICYKQLDHTWHDSNVDHIKVDYILIKMQ